MSNTEQPLQVAWWARLSEDWWAVLIAGLLIVLVDLGVLSGIPW